MQITINIHKRAAALIIAVLALTVPTVALAAGTFDDDDGSTFENDIEWLAAAGVTRGCDAGDPTKFCPDDNVTRGQMAAFMRRLAGGDPAVAPSVDADKVDGLDSPQLSVQGWERVEGNLIVLGPGQFGTATANCPAGKRVVGGGYVTVAGVPEIDVFRNYPVDADTWSATGQHVAGANNSSFRAVALCAIVN